MPSEAPEEVSKQRELDRRILEAATSAFASQGFDATKVADIAKRAKVAVGTIYLRYPTKSALLGGVLRRTEHRFVEAMLQDRLQACPWPERFAEMFSVLLETAATDPDLAQLMPLASYATFEDWKPGDNIREQIATIVHTGQVDRVFRQSVEPETVAAIAHGMVEGAMQMAMASGSVDPRKIVHHLADAASRWLMEPTPS